MWFNSLLKYLLVDFKDKNCLQIHFKTWQIGNLNGFEISMGMVLEFKKEN